MEIKKIGEGSFVPQPIAENAPHVVSIKEFNYRDEYGNVAVFNGVTGELVRYQSPEDNRILFYVEYPDEYFNKGKKL
jgi:hypothetical protein